MNLFGIIYCQLDEHFHECRNCYYVQDGQGRPKHKQGKDDEGHVGQEVLRLGVGYSCLGHALHRGCKVVFTPTAVESHWTLAVLLDEKNRCRRLREEIIMVIIK